MRLTKKNWPVLALGAVLLTGLALPLATGASPVGFYIEVMLGGLMAGVLYSLVALGFALIFKASGVFNFAQGAMVLFAALAVARLGEKMPLWLAMILAMAIMVVLAVAGHGDVKVAQQVEHAIDEGRDQKRNVAARDVRGVDAVDQRAKADQQPCQRAEILLLVVGDLHAGRQLGRRLIRRGDDDHVFDRDGFAQQSHDPLQHQLGAKRQRRLVAAHAARFATAENDGPCSHKRMLILDVGC